MNAPTPKTLLEEQAEATAVILDAVAEGAEMVHVAHAVTLPGLGRVEQGIYVKNGSWQLVEATGDEAGRIVTAIVLAALRAMPRAAKYSLQPHELARLGKTPDEVAEAVRTATQKMIPSLVEAVSASLGLSSETEPVVTATASSMSSALAAKYPREGK